MYGEHSHLMLGLWMRLTNDGLYRIAAEGGIQLPGPRYDG
jgi:hypothetical protein